MEKDEGNGEKWTIEKDEGNGEENGKLWKLWRKWKMVEKWKKYGNSG